MQFSKTYWMVVARGVFLEENGDPCQFARTTLYIDSSYGHKSPISECLLSSRRQAKNVKKQFKRRYRDNGLFHILSVDIKEVEVSHNVTFKE